MNTTYKKLAYIFGLAILGISIALYIAMAAEVTIEDTLTDSTDEFTAGSKVVFTSDTTGYAFYTSGGLIEYQKTADSGATWGDPVSVDAGTDNCCVSVWYDQWTPGDTSGTRIHIMWMDSGDDDVFYRALDTSDDTYDAAAVVALPGNTISSSGSNFANAIGKATDGTLFISNTAGADNLDFATSTDGVTWREGNPGTGNIGFVGGNDIVSFQPLASGDMLAIWLDISADALVSRKYTASTHTWDVADTTISTSIVDQATSFGSTGYGASVYKATNDIYVIAANALNTTTGDAQVFKYSSGSWSTKTDLTTNISLFDAKVFIDDNTGDVYGLFIDESAGTNTADIRWKKSTDGGVTWGATSTVSTTQDNHRTIGVAGSSKERVYAVWFNDDLNDMLGDTVANLVPPAPPAAAPQPVPEIILVD